MSLGQGFTFSVFATSVRAQTNSVRSEAVDLRVHLSGSLIFSKETAVCPTVGSAIRIRTTSYKKGLTAGSLISIPITAEDPPEIDYETDVIFVDANGYSVIEEGPEPNA
ncbi:hypothetical protein [Brevundimonas sp.]|uniref:hypothetical protein n=1 Tax=Brevundimonas sp. TaxID=1871086 RepID=UPI0025C72CF9|nr:hypothetical protein [Brevundimonas sp.]